MNLSSEIFGEVVVVHAPQEIVDDNADLLRATLQDLPKSQVVLDLDGTEVVDSAGLEMLLDVQESLRARYGNLVLCTSQEPNRKIFEITRLDEHLDLFDSVIDAVKSFG